MRNNAIRGEQNRRSNQLRSMMPADRVARRPAAPSTAVWVVCAGLVAGSVAPQWARSQPTGPQPAPAGASQLAREVWDVFYVQGARVGYAQTTVRRLTVEGESLSQIDMVYRLKLKRFGQVNEEELTLSSLETPEGQVRQFQTRMTLGAAPMTVRGTVQDGFMNLETTTAGKTVNSRLPWTSEVGGFYASDQSLLRRPMQPGEVRKLKSFMPPLNVVAEIEMRGVRYERSELLNGTYELLRIESDAHLPGGARLSTVLWANRRGEVLKSHSDALGQDSYRVSKQVALNQADTEAFDLGADSIVRITRPLPQGHQSAEARYRVRLPGSDPAAVFEVGPTQSIEAIDNESAWLTVRRLSLADAPVGDPPPDSGPTPEDRQPNSLVQSDDPTVVALAKQVVADDDDPRQLALALEQFVHANITQKNFSQAFATAAEVAQTREGDCTEHAVLLAALARARNLPARVAVGLVYMPNAQGFGYHMWNEVYIDSRWWPLDATLAMGGIGAGHLKLAHSSLAGASAYTSLLPVAQVLGRLQLDLVESR